MTDYFVNSAATGLNTGLNETDAWTSLASAYATATVLGDRVFVDPAHLENLSADANYSAGGAHTRQNPLQIIVANLTTKVPVANYGASGNGEINGGTSWHVNFDGNQYIWGLRIITGDTVAITDSQMVYENCYWAVEKSTTSEQITMGAQGDTVSLINSDVKFDNHDHRLAFNNDAQGLEMIGGSLSANYASTSQSLFQISADRSAQLWFANVDMRGVHANRNMFSFGTTVELTNVYMVNCPLADPAPSITNDTIDIRPPGRITITGEQPYMRREFKDTGNLIEETTILRDGGASDGTIPFSLKIQSNSNAKRTRPFRILLACQNVGNLSGKTIKIHFAQNSGVPTALKSSDIWIESNIATSTGMDHRTSGEAPGVVGSDLTDESASEVWKNGVSDLSGYTEQSMSLSGFGTTQGMVYIWLCVAADFSVNNLYVCPKPEIA